MNFSGPVILLLLALFIQSFHLENTINYHTKYSSQNVNIFSGISTGLCVGNSKEAFLSRRVNKTRAAILDRNPKRHILFSLLLLAGDININPGPYAKCPCGACGKPVKRNQSSTQCDSCYTLHHVSCMQISTSDYEILASACMWICPKCDLANFSNGLLEPSTCPLESSNSFCLLSEPKPACNTTRIIDDERAPRHPKPKARSRTRSRPIRRKALKFCLMNCQSIRSKRPDLEVVINDLNPDIIMGTESWLNPDIQNSEIFPPGYTIFRKDRTSTRGGGVFQAIKSDLLASVRPEFDTDCECIWSRCQIKSRKS